MDASEYAAVSKMGWPLGLGEDNGQVRFLGVAE